MSHFYGTIPVSARKTQATARGHKSTGLITEAASHSGAIRVELAHTNGKDMFTVMRVMKGEQNEITNGELLAEGEL